MNAAPAQRIDRYELVEPIGQGGFAAVWRARHVHTGQTVALKVVADDGKGGVARLLREARAMAEVSNPHVARVFDCGVTEDGRGFVAMELVEGQELKRLMGAGPLPFARAIDIALQVLDGLSLVHARGVVHRDVKPSNVFVTTVADTLGATRDLVKLIDFGISKLSTPNMISTFTSPGTSMGTPGYMAPEQLGTALEADARADVYGVAATLYEMLSGRLPHTADSYEDFVVKVRTERPAPLASIAPHLPAPLAEVVDRGLARDRDARWASAAQFADALRAAASGAQVGAPAPGTFVSVPPSPPAPSLRTFQSAPPVAHTTDRAQTAPPPRPEGSSAGWILGLGAVGLLVVAAAGGGLWWWRQHAKDASAALAPIASSQAGVPPAAPAPTAPVDDTATTATATTLTTTPAPAPTTTTTPAIATATTTTGARATPAGASAVKLDTTVVGGSSGVHVGPPKIVGTAEALAMQRLAAKATPLIGPCRKAKADTVRVQLFVQSDGSISIAKADPDNRGDPLTAGCVARRFQDVPPADPHGSGIVSFDVTLDALR